MMPPEPKLTHRPLRERATRIDQARAVLEATRCELVTEIEEQEAVLAAMKRQLGELDSMLHRGPREMS